MNEDRAITLLKACRDLLQKQMDANYVLNILTETVYYDEADCCGACLLDDINCLLEELKTHVNNGDRIRQMNNRELAKEIWSWHEELFGTQFRFIDDIERRLNKDLILDVHGQ